jgi:nitrogen fixation NifU-like protein
MTDELYPRALLRLAADAQGSGTLPRPDARGEAHNPTCGDRVGVQLALTDGRITALAHQTQACVLTQASAALLTQAAPGHDLAGLTALAGDIRAMLAGGLAPAGYDVFEGVAGHAGRHICVLLPLQAALNALEEHRTGERSEPQGARPSKTAEEG